MCLLINQNKETSIIETEKLETAFDSNPDGVGFAYGDGSTVQVHKFRDFKPFLSAYKTAHKKHGKTSDFVIHFRWQTHGMNKGTFNVHPFTINDGFAFAHNGVINKVDNDVKLSDTQVFNRDILRPLKLQTKVNAVLLKLLADYIGNGNKLAFVNKYGESQIVNEMAGHWLDGAWFSNYSYESYGACYSNPMYTGGYVSTKAKTGTAKHKPVKHQTRMTAVCNSCGITKLKTKLTYEKHAGGYWITECDECKHYFDRVENDFTKGGYNV